MVGNSGLLCKTIFPSCAGLEEKSDFYERYVAFYADYVKLARLLSKDTVLLVPGIRLSAAYAPKPIFFDAADLPPGKQTVLFAPPETIENSQCWCTVGRQIDQTNCFRAQSHHYR